MTTGPHKPNKGIEVSCAKKVNERLIMGEGQSRFILLDRDGVINRRRSSGPATCWDKFEFFPRALEALHLLAVNHYTGIVISRQPCNSDGPQTPAELDSVTRRFLLEVAISQGHIAQVYYCRHRDVDACDCYNPDAGLISRAKADHGFRPEETYFVSESKYELGAAAAAGCPCIRIQRDAFLQTQIQKEELCKVASNLYDAAEQILASGQVYEHEYAALPA
jgi:histidinol phosphatase-like enzyme